VRRPERNSARVLSLAIAGALLFVVGYFAGSRYANPPLDDVTAVLLETAPLMAPAGVDLGGRWHLAAVGNTAEPGCRDLLRRLASTYNRLAHRPGLHAAINVVFLDAQADTGTSGGAAGHALVVGIAPQAARGFARQLGQGRSDALDCADAPLALLDPEVRLRALLPATSDPATAAHDLERLLEHFGVGE
jgi:hypothetical protein